MDSMTNELAVILPRSDPDIAPRYEDGTSDVPLAKYGPALHIQAGFGESQSLIFTIPSMISMSWVQRSYYHFADAVLVLLFYMNEESRHPNLTNSFCRFIRKQR